MELGIVGLGKMGGNMAERLLAAGHRIVGFDPDPGARERLVGAGGTAVASIEELCRALRPPRAIWIMVPSGKPTADTLQAVAAGCSPGDVLVDGGNSNYRDSQARAETLAARGLLFLDVGTSGGIWGRTEGYALMIGGPREAVERLRPIFEALAPAPDRGWGHVGPSGAGHFVKMIHNGIEYGMMQAFAEGFAILKKKDSLGLDLLQIARIWQHGSVVRSWLLDLLVNVLQQDQDLEDVAPWVADSGEGRWTVAESIDLDVPAPVIALSLLTRFRSRDGYAYYDRLLAALRQQFGGHAVRRAE
ncbi:MAG: decarboxylating 6-phosphogluconate dehydrogenase [Myxococcota bacterium]|nr:decarboxylating 6-phosphogluconate dehydrogenase [Myxococcota bacterium]MDW8361585.1 decarboxylating 6-phosphogluconate dehydrogenase [Myxococcales bacterium]